VVLLDKGRVVAADAWRTCCAARWRRTRSGEGHRGVLRGALVQHGATCSTTPRGTLLVQTPGRDVRLVFAAAAESSCQIRQLVPSRQSLGEMFAHNVTGSSHADP